MRDQLKKFDWHIYGLSLRDLDEAVDIVRRIRDEKTAYLDEQYKKAIIEVPDIAHDVMDDTIYYSLLDVQFLWAYCLWRLQAIFEGIIVSRLLSKQSIKGGLTAKLRALESAGYSLTGPEKAELLDWARLRNALSHMPPEAYTPAGIGEDDVVEYAKLLRRILVSWGITDDPV